MPEPGTYLVCDTCSITRNVLVAPNCPVCIVNAGKRVPLKSHASPSRTPHKRLSAEELQSVRQIEDAFAFVLGRYNVPTDILLKRSRRRYTIDARFELAFLLNKVLGLSTTRTAELMNRRHTTVMYAVRQYESSYES